MRKNVRSATRITEVQLTNLLVGWSDDVDIEVSALEPDNASCSERDAVAGKNTLTEAARRRRGQRTRTESSTQCAACTVWCKAYQCDPRFNFRHVGAPCVQGGVQRDIHLETTTTHLTTDEGLLNFEIDIKDLGTMFVHTRRRICSASTRSSSSCASWTQ